MSKGEAVPADNRINSLAIRILDFVGAGLGLAVASPLLGVIAVAIRSQDGGPALYRARRIGRDGKPFTLYKFRTMQIDADKTGRPLTTSNDDRITPLGRRLRRYKLDELPQLLNVLRGEMGLVGPRPEDARFVQVYSETQRQLLKARPGITSPASLRFRHEESLLSSDKSEKMYVEKILPRKLALELEYMERRNIRSDLRVIMQTIGAIPALHYKINMFFLMRNRYLFLLDVILLSFAPLLAIWVRLESLSAVNLYVMPLCIFTLVVVATKLNVYVRTGLYTEFWPYASAEELFTLTRATALGAAAEIAIFFGIMLPLHALPGSFPRSLPLLDGLLSSLLVGGARLTIRLWFARHKRLEEVGAFKPVIVAGAGVAGSMIIKEMRFNGQLGLRPVGILDDDPHKQGIRMHGLRVLGTLSDLKKVVKETKAKEVIIAIPTASGKVVRGIMHACKEAGVASKTIPGLFEILQGSAGVAQIRNIRLEDLLRRGAVKTDTESLYPFFRGTKVLVTGAGGSIGSELCRQVRDLGPTDLILLGHGENSIYQIAQELRENPRPGLRFHQVIADVRDRERMQQVFQEFQPDIVLHAAAHKHVPLMQENPTDAVTNNVMGTRIVADLSARYNVKRFVLVSSDKAVNPTSIMGVTKRIAELVVQDAARTTGLPFITVRFGNVLGSRGSVVPLFEKQIDNGGPLTITHPEVRRYFMTIPEAVQLILHAGTMGSGGEVFVLDMGEQIRVLDLARDLIRLRGLEESKDIEIKFTGMRPGEKLHEDLFFESDKVELTKHEKILVCRDGFPGEYEQRPELAPHEQPFRLEVDTLIEAAQQGGVPMVDRLFAKLVPEYHPSPRSEDGAAPATIFPIATGVPVRV